MRNPKKLLTQIIVICLIICCILCLSACTDRQNPNETKATDSSATGNTNKPATPSGDTDNANNPVAQTNGSSTATKHNHNYIDYKCTSCGVLQDGHLCDYLISWVQKNGTAHGETISVDKTVDGVLYGLTYNTSGKYFFFSLLDSQYDDFLSIKFTDKKGTYEIAYLQGEQPSGREIYGSVYAPEFTKNTPISVDTYHGPSDQRPNAAENARICTGLMLDFLKQFLVENNVGITLQDLGFSAY